MSSKVAIMECAAYEPSRLSDAINRGIAAIGGWEKFVRPGMKVLLKVNLIGPKPPESAAVTHCELVRAVALILKNLGCEVWIGDSAGGAIAGVAPTARAFEVSGLKKMAEEIGATLKNFDREGVVAADGRSSLLDGLYLARPIFDADLVINLPKLKSHSGCIYTGAVKNVFGCIPGLRKAEYHKAAPDSHLFGNVLVDIHEAARFPLHIMDGVLAMDGDGPTAGSPYPANKILISEDPLALDAAALGMLGLRAHEIPVLRAAIERKLGEADTDKILFLGDYASPPPLSGFRLPARFAFHKKQSQKAIRLLVDFLKSKPAIDPKTCKKCNVCVDSCPMQAIDRTTKEISYAKCIECMCCHELCPHQAVYLKRSNPLASVFMKLYRGPFR